MNPGFEALLQAISDSRERKENNAIILGFEATQALIQHSSKDDLIADLLGPDAFVPEHLYTERIGDRWTHLTARERQRFMKRHMTTRPDRPVDREAVGALAQIIKKGYLRAVVATDPAELLVRLISQIAPVMRLECARFKPEALQFGFSRDPAEPVFIDGGELLLQGFKPNSFNFGEDHGRPMLDALRAFIGHFDHVLCWGWCGLNIPFNFVCPDQESVAVYALGGYTRCDLGSRNPFQRAWIDDEAVATTTIIRRVATGLGLDDEVAGTISPVPMAAGTANPTVMSVVPMLRPLLRAEVLRTFTSSEMERRITICGVEGVAERRSAGSWLYHELGQQGEICLHRESADLIDLGRYITLQTENVESAHIVGVLTDMPVHEDWVSRFLTLVSRWSAVPALSSDPGVRITLFCPTDMSSKVSYDFRNHDNVMVEWHYARGYFTYSNVFDWLSAETSARLGVNDPVVLERLARQIIADVGDYDGFPPDTLAEALELLQFDLARALRQAPGATPRGDHLEAPSLIDLWADIDRRFRSTGLSLEATFSLQIEPVEPDIEIGPITVVPDGDE